MSYEVFSYYDEERTIQTNLGIINWNKQKIKATSYLNPSIVEAVRFFEDVETRLPNGWASGPEVYLELDENKKGVRLIIEGDAD